MVEQFTCNQIKNSRDTLCNQKDYNNKNKYWEIKNYVDKYGDKISGTNVGYVVNRQPIRGTFDNSVTTDSLLSAQIIFDTKDGWNVYIFLFEYGNLQVKEVISHNEEYKIYIKNSDGKEYVFYGTNIGDRIKLDNDLYFFEILEKGGDLKFSILKSDKSQTKYRFTLKNNESNFCWAFNKIAKKSQ